MTRKPPYYSERNGRAFFELGKRRAEQSGMRSSYPLGPAGLDAMKAASDLYYEYSRATMMPAPPVRAGYIKGTLGHWYARFREKERFKRFKPATRTEYDDLWDRRIQPELGDIPLSKITPARFEAFFLKMERDHGVDGRWRTVKIARSIFNAAVKYDVIAKSPCNTLVNTPPPPRNAFWYAHEVRELVRVAEANGYQAMALGIRIAWETLMSPTDVRTLTRSQLRSDREGGYLVTERDKTGAQVFAALSDELWRDIHAYIDALPFDLPDDVPFLRTVRDQTAYLRPRYSNEFAIVRKLAFGPNETRKLMDIRRSGNLEADLGGASAEDRAEILANNIHKDAGLHETYTPATVTKARAMRAVREAGRRALQAESLKVETSSRKTKTERG